VVELIDRIDVVGTVDLIHAKDRRDVTGMIDVIDMIDQEDVIDRIEVKGWSVKQCRVQVTLLRHVIMLSCLQNVSDKVWQAM
jgi:hypothetical protein